MKMFSNCIFLTKIPRTVVNTARTCSNSHDDIITQNIGDKGVIILNRPKLLNALTLSMAKKIYYTLRDWESEKSLVLMKSADGRAFSVGGDIRTIIESHLKGNTQCQELFRYQYVIKKLVSSYKIPYISFIDGLIMGSAASFSLLGEYCIATERTSFAMPETQIGFFPDGGSAYFLSKLENRLGWYLGLTGHRLKGTDIINAGITKYYCNSDNLKYLEHDLLLSCSDDSIKTILKKFNTAVSEEFTLMTVEEKINNYFSANTIEDLISNLEKDNSKWARDTINILNKMCPSSLKITLRELELGQQSSLNDCLKMEYTLAINCLKRNNFYEGIRSFINKNHNPKWNPSTLSEVSTEFVESHFSNISEDEGRT